MTFEEAVKYLLSLGHETLAMKLGLGSVGRLLAALGSPQDSFPAVQIAGTNGKGSTAAMLDAICRAAGVRAGLYTSPHLVSVTERVRVGGREIAPGEFARLTVEVRAAALGLRAELGALPTFFEHLTALALLAFREARVELAILETGLGGRLDAVTAARAATVCLTPVALDHQEYLGPTLREIASEKAAVIRPGARAVIAVQEAEAMSVILARCRECGVTPRRADSLARDARVAGATGDGRLVVNFRTAEDAYENVTLALRGRHQLTNAAAAVALAEELRGQGFRQFTRAAIVEGLETAEHAGRLELVAVGPEFDGARTQTGAARFGLAAAGSGRDAGRPECDDGQPERDAEQPERDAEQPERGAARGAGGTPVLFDGAHNAAGARALRAYLDEFAPRRVTLVFGAMRDKDLTEIAAALFPAAERLILTRVDSPRAAEPGALAELVPRGFDRARLSLSDSAAEALRAALEATPPGGLVCVTGSLYLVGEIKSLLARGRA